MHRRTFLKAGSALLAGTAVFRAKALSRTVCAGKGSPEGRFQESPLFHRRGWRVSFLTGTHTWANFQESGTAPIPTFDWEGYLSMMQAHNHNFMRLWAWQQSAWAPWAPDKILSDWISP
jgi:hypothetical protein